MYPKGNLLIIGGSNHTKRAHPHEVLHELITYVKKGTLEIITTGSRASNLVKTHYEKIFTQIPGANINFMALKSKEEAHDKTILARLKNAGGIFFTGGNQSRIAEVLAGTPVNEIIKSRYYQDENFILAGTSAGAMVLPDMMIAGGGNDDEILTYDLRTASGLNILSHLIIDTHFIKRSRFLRLVQAITFYPNRWGVGLGEDTALFISNGKKAECRGPGTVVIMDGNKIKNTDINKVQSHAPICIENLKINFLSKGYKFSLPIRPKVEE